ncbi:efflux RND transporter periplasmic adaptor subunit [Methylobacillus methanolivorans]
MKRCGVWWLCAVLALAGCGSKAAAPQAAEPKLSREGGLVSVAADSPLRRSLVVEAVQAQAFSVPIDAPGVIEAMPERVVKITPPLVGRIVKLQHGLGDVVRAGDLLVTLDSAELAAAYSDNAKAQAVLQQARREFARQEGLMQDNIPARKEFEAAQLALAAAENDARASSERLAQLGVAVQAESHREYGLRSPIAGRVVELNGAQGGYWNDVTAPVMTVADLSSVWVSASIAEKDIAHMFVGQAAHIKLNAYGEQVFSGQVKYIGDLLDPETRTVKVRVLVDNRQGQFKPGMFARATFAGQSHQAVLVPATTLLQSGLYTRVFVEHAPFQFESRIVTIGATVNSTVGDQVEILAGLQAGERVVTHNGVMLND